MRAVEVIGFTGTIASGKTSRCAHLRAVAERYAAAAAAAVTSTHTTTITATALARGERGQGAQAVRVHSINADHVGHAVYAPGKPCYYDVLRHFGTQILSTTTTTTAATADTATTTGAAQPPIDRRALGALVFASPDKLRELSSICWPYIVAAVRDELQAVQEACKGRSNKKYDDNANDDNDAKDESESDGGGAAEVLVVLLEAAVLTQNSGLLQLCDEVWLTHCRRDVAVARVMARDGLSATDAARRVDSQGDVQTQLAQLSAQRGVFAGPVRTFDTSDVTLHDGLREVDEAFRQFWHDKVASHLTTRQA